MIGQEQAPLLSRASSSTAPPPGNGRLKSTTGRLSLLVGICFLGAWIFNSASPFNQAVVSQLEESPALLQLEGCTSSSCADCATCSFTTPNPDDASRALVTIDVSGCKKDQISWGCCLEEGCSCMGPNSEANPHGVLGGKCDEIETSVVFDVSAAATSLTYQTHDGSFFGNVADTHPMCGGSGSCDKAAPSGVCEMTIDLTTCISEHPCADVCPEGTCDSWDDAEKPECKDCAACQRAWHALLGLEPQLNEGEAAAERPTFAFQAESTTGEPVPQVDEKEEYCPDGSVNPCFGNKCRIRGDATASCNIVQLDDNFAYECICSEFFYEKEADGVMLCAPKSVCTSTTCGEGTCEDIGRDEYICKCHEGYFFNGEHCADIDGCLDNQCGEGALTCQDVPAPALATAAGQYTCVCKKGYYFCEGECREKDPCKLNPNQCGDNGLCLDDAPEESSGDGFACDCNDCYKEVDGFCVNINYCLEEDVIDEDGNQVVVHNKHKCNANGDEEAKCENSECGMECVCTTGFREETVDGKKTCVDIDFCKESAFDGDADPECECQDETAPSLTYSCNCKNCYASDKANEQEPAGYPQCHAIDHCTDNTRCNTVDEDAVCETFTTGVDNCGFTCKCSTGYENPPGDAESCRQINPCEDTGGKTLCQPHGDCVDVQPDETCPESFTCACDSCYEAQNLSESEECSGQMCVDIDECAAGGTAACLAGDPKAECLEEDGTCKYTCDCSTGYRCTDESCQACEEINPCTDDASRCTNGECNNLLPPALAWTCTCNDCYEMETLECETDECGQKCVDINECKDHGLATCTTNDKGAKCDHQEGICGYTCECSDGYKCTDESCQGCVEIDPCKDDETRCGPGTCVDLDPTSTSFTCNCQECYESVQLVDGDREGGEKCVDINECDVHGLAKCRSLGNLNATCSHGDGDCAYECGCTTGWECEDDACQSCREVNPCRDDEETQLLCTNGKCVDNEPKSESYQCECDTCWEMAWNDVETEDPEQGQKCVDVDECVDHECNAQGDKNATCTHGEGDCEHTCHCSTGYECQGDKCHSCREIDPCAEDAKAETPSLCLDGQCIDEQPDGLCPASFTCKCNDCYKPKDSGNCAGFTCVDVDECAEEGNAACTAIDKDATCSHDEGDCEFKCTCTTGYECGDAACKSCKEVNPCEDEEVCAPHGECVDNRPGMEVYDSAPLSHTCKCDRCYESFPLENGGEQCRDIDECDGNTSCASQGDTESQCIEPDGPYQEGNTFGGIVGNCGYSCMCTAGYRKSPDGHVCVPMNPCEDEENHVDCGDHGTCQDEDAPSETAVCLCDKCYESAVSGEQNLGAAPCVNHNYCEGPSGEQRHHCDLVGDDGATCVDHECKYSCECSKGYHEVDGVCEDINDCVGNNCNEKWADSGTCVDNAAPETGYECYCHCGFQFDSTGGFCDKCEELKAVQNLDSSSVGTVILTNDDVHLQIDIDVMAPYELVQTHVNVNGGIGRSDIRTQKDGHVYQVSGSNADGTCVPDPEAYGVVRNEKLAAPHASSKHEYKYSIPLSDLELSAEKGKLPGCGLTVLVYLELYNTQTEENTVFFARDEAGPGVDLIKCGNGDFFGLTTYTLCGVPICSDDTTTVEHGYATPEPTTPEPTTPEPTTPEPTTPEPTTPEPTTPEPTTPEPTTPEPTTPEPTTTEPTTTEPTTPEPTTPEPTTPEPTTPEPTTPEPTTPEPTEPTTPEPTTPEPTTPEPTTPEPTTPEPTTPEPTTPEPTTPEPTTPEPTTPEPTTPEPTTPEPTTPEPTTPEPTTPEPTTPEPTTPEPTTPEPTTPEPTTPEPTTPEPTTLEPTTLEPTTPEPTGECPDYVPPPPPDYGPCGKGFFGEVGSCKDIDYCSVANGGPGGPSPRYDDTTKCYCQDIAAPSSTYTCSSCGGNDNDMCYKPVCTVFLLDDCGKETNQPDFDNCAPICKTVDPCIEGQHICRSDGDKQAHCSFDNDYHACDWQCECSDGFERSDDGQYCLGGGHGTTSTEWTTSEEPTYSTTEELA